MDILWLRITNVVTTGNLSIGLSIILFGIYGYYRIRRYIAQQHAEFLAYVATLTAQQTTRIEACIHQVPGHPENSFSAKNSENKPENQEQK